MATQARFQNAILNARQLPPDLLTNSQKLKLYALYKQTESPAPPEAPPKTNALARAKWEAWNDVRSLSVVQAMESYYLIIEGLVSMMESVGSLPAEGTKNARFKAAAKRVLVWAAQVREKQKDLLRRFKEAAAAAAAEAEAAKAGEADATKSMWALVRKHRAETVAAFQDSKATRENSHACSRRTSISSLITTA